MSRFQSVGCLLFRTAIGFRLFFFGASMICLTLNRLACHKGHWFAVCAIGWLLSQPSATIGADPNEAIEFFERNVRPVLADHCWKCHGPDKQWASLRLDSREAILRGGDSGPAIVPGKPDESRLVQAVRHQGDVQMPPDEELNEKQIASLTRWVEIGAPWPARSRIDDEDHSAARQRDHWAFQPVRKPALPEVAGDPRIRTPIDRFVLARLQARGLAPSPPADRRTLIRRVTYDLTGLPPAAEEVDALVGDDTLEAYARLVDRLLDSPHYGEQWGRHWLDVARYSDTKGYVYAREERFWVHAWSYRDWVVQALNDDMPYDRFLQLQIAADQIAPDDPGALAAMGFFTLGRRFLGVTHDVIDDRIDVVTRGTLGLTVSCARCHDHKYDPIPTADYYSLYGVFDSCWERMVPLSTASSQEDAAAAVPQELLDLQQKQADTLAARRAEASSRARARAGDYLAAQLELEKYPEQGFDQILTKDDLLPAVVRRWQVYLAQAARAGDPVFAAWHAYAVLDRAQFADQAANITQQFAERDDARINPLVAEAFRAPPASMYEVAERYGKLLADVDGRWLALQQQAREAQQSLPERLDDPAAESIRQVLYGSESPCVVPDEPIVNIETLFDTSTCEELWKLQGEVDRWLIRTAGSPPYAMVLVDRPPIADPRIFLRGNPANKGAEVPRQCLGVLAGPDRKPFEHGSGRRELADAIVDPANPLTARVIVNRVWMHHFGQGLVRTPSDFGTRAEPPSHPELLDWLANWFVEEGWSLKKLHRMILLSATYQQSSFGPEDESLRDKALRADPANRWLWRMNTHRLTWEETRDSLLAVTGQLDQAVGGRAVDLFSQPFSRRRTLYGLVDRQFLPTILRTFDFANPDLHIPRRNDTTVSQQALFFLNHPLVVQCAQTLARKPDVAAAGESAQRVERMYRAALQREPTPVETQAALALVRAAEQEDPGETPGAGLDPWEQLAQVLLLTNEFLFVD